jgi:hypothetical protein
MAIYASSPMFATALSEEMDRESPVSTSEIPSKHRPNLRPAILKALADKLIPGVPENLRILLVGQVEEIASAPVGGSLKPTENPTVVQHVVESDSFRQGLLWEMQSVFDLNSRYIFF